MKPLRYALAILLTVMPVVPVAQAVAAPPARVDVYTTPGTHFVNGRQWTTSCEPYSSSVYRCRTNIWASQIARTKAGQYETKQGWVFNNLTYLPAPRATWANNPLAAGGRVGGTAAWTGPDGRRWRTECDTTTTGSNGCRSYAWTSVATRTSAGYTTVSTWVFNNIVRFGPSSVAPPKPCQLAVEGIKVDLQPAQTTATVVKTSGTRAVVTMVKRAAPGSCDVETVFTDSSGWIGYGGAVPASSRKQSTGTTPQGTFTISEGFGLAPDPGTSLPYRRPTSDSYWVLDPQSPFYNQWREGSSGGFQKGDSERLVDFPGQYAYAAVIDYNRWPAVQGKGGAIFLHVHGKGTTAGCVSVTAENMKTFLRNVTVGDPITIK